MGELGRASCERAKRKNKGVYDYGCGESDGEFVRVILKLIEILDGVFVVK